MRSNIPSKRFDYGDFHTSRIFAEMLSIYLISLESFKHIVAISRRKALIKSMQYYSILILPQIVLVNKNVWSNSCIQCDLL